MKDIKGYEQDLSSIRLMMERSVKFISLSGLSGVLAGIYALAGASVAYVLLDRSILGYTSYEDGDMMSLETSDTSLLWKLVSIALAVLVASLATGVYFSSRKAKKTNTSLWNTTSQRMFSAMAVPLVTGGIFIIILLFGGYFALAAPLTLLFYGLALVHGSQYTFDEVRYLGYCEIILGLLASMLPGYGLLFWAIGFGVLHIGYGAFMYYKHEQ
jgi:hypothetical protein